MEKYKVYLRDNRYWVTSPIVSDLLKNLGGRRVGAEYRFPRMRWVLKRLLATIGVNYLAFHKDVVADYKQIVPSDFTLDPELAQFLVTPQGLTYQQDTARYLLTRPSKSALVNMDPGLGKTRTSIVTAMMTGAKKILVIAPKSFLPGWQYEIAQVDSSPSHIYHRQVGGGVKWSLSNYETVADFHEGYLEQKWDVIIIDESLAVKNRKSMRAKLAGRLRPSTKYLWLLSGSPVSKYADDLFKQLQVMEPKAFSSYWRFAEMYCVIERGPWATKVIGNKSGIDLRDEFADIIYTLKEHELNLKKPAMKYEVLVAPMVPMQRKAFDDLTREFVAELETGSVETENVAARLTYLQQIVSHPHNVDLGWSHGAGKLEVLQDAFLGERIPIPAIIWTWWKQTPFAIRAALEGLYSVGILTGSYESPEGAIKKFQEGKLDILIISLGVGRYGHTFNNARSAVYYDRTFDMDAFIQSQQRIAGGIRGEGLKHVPITFTLKTPMSTDDLIEENLTVKAFSFAHVASHDLATMLKKLSVR